MYISGFHPGFFNWGGGVPASFARQILYLITKLGKSLTRPFPGVAIEQRVLSGRLGFSRNSMQSGTLRRRGGGGVYPKLGKNV